MKRSPDIRARDRADRDHHPGRDQVADRDQEDRVDASEHHDAGGVQQLGCDQGYSVDHA